MGITNERPVNLNILTIRFPIPAIVSILHRLTGIALFLLLPFAIWALSLSLSSEDNFNMLKDFLSLPLIKCFFWAFFIVPFSYHFVAGIRHLLMDVHIGEELNSGRLASQLTILITIILVTLLGVWLW